MIHYMESLYGLHNPDNYIYHSDLDEIVDPQSLRQAVAEMDRGECDFVTGVWQDRVTLDGALNRVSISSQNYIMIISSHYRLIPCHLIS